MKFHGSYVALVTPFNEDGSIDFGKLKELTQWHLDNGTDGIVALGTTGESSTMSHEEDDAVVRCVLETVNGKIPVIAGAGSNSTQTQLEKSRKYCELGADGLLLISPYYNKANDEGMYRHFATVADTVDMPIILYNVPGRTGCSISPSVVARLAKHPNVAGIKEASGNISQIVKLMTLTDGNIDLYSGNDDQVVPLMSMGGIGVISVVSNIAPRVVHDMCDKMLKGDVKGAAQIQKDTLELCENLFSEVNPIPVKKAVNLMGFNAGPLRMPLTEMEEANAKKLETAMRNFGLLK